MESGQVSFGLFHIKENNNWSGCSESHTSFRLIRAPGTSRVTAGPVAGLSVGKAITPGGYFTQICILVFGWFSELVLFTH